MAFEILIEVKVAMLIVHRSRNVIKIRLRIKVELKIEMFFTD